MLPSCITTTADVNPAESAEQFIGLHERHNRQQIKDFVGVDPVRTEWCAAFVNAVLELDGIPGSQTVSDNPLLARSFLNWGQEIQPQDIKPGDIVIFPRGNVSWQGHVGFFVGATDNHWIILGGNQNNTVNYQLFKPSRTIGIRRWVE